MDAPDPLHEAVAAVGQFLVADVPLGRTLDRVAALARDAIAPALSVGLTLLDADGRRPATRVFTDEVSPAVDRGQYDDDDGPCLEALRDGRVVRVGDAAEVADRWPSFSRRAVEHGVLSVLSLPLTAGGERLGAMNLYAAERNAFSQADQDDAALFATQAAVVLANARAYWVSYDLTAGLRRALESRAVIDMAKGKIMASSGRGPDAAFSLLVSASQRENVPLREVARRIVEGQPPPWSDV